MSPLSVHPSALEREDGDASLPIPPPSRVFLAPMVRGSELAFRSLVRQYAPEVVCYSPMLRANEIIKAATGTSFHEDGVLFREDIRKDDQPLVVQLCGNSPATLAQATRILIEQSNIIGIDLNLGCPQACAKRGGFGSFLDPRVAVQCVAAMNDAISDQSVQLSCKIRLLPVLQDTIQLALELQRAGCQLLTVHCRQRTDKHDGAPDLEAARQIINALDIPVLINGPTWKTAPRALQSTEAHGIMMARDFLRNSRLLQGPVPPELLAADYLDYAHRYPPPSHLYLQNHLRWIFRAELEPSKSEKYNGDHYKTDWKPRLWTFLARPFVDCWEQYAMVVVLYCLYSDCEVPPTLQQFIKPEPSFNSIRHYHGYGQDEGQEEEQVETAHLLFG